MKPGWVGGQLQLPRGKTKTTMAGSTELRRTRANERKYLWVKNTFFALFRYAQPWKNKTFHSQSDCSVHGVVVYQSNHTHDVKDSEADRRAAHIDLDKENEQCGAWRQCAKVLGTVTTICGQVYSYYEHHGDPARLVLGWSLVGQVGSGGNQSSTHQPG